MSEVLVTKDFYLSEFIVSDTAARLGIDNTPNASVLATLCNVLIPGMQAVRDLLGAPVLIKSGYRCPALNQAVRGAHNSQHMDGHACELWLQGTARRAGCRSSSSRTWTASSSTSSSKRAAGCTSRSRHGRATRF
jgi:hypothetical protein